MLSFRSVIIMLPVFVFLSCTESRTGDQQQAPVTGNTTVEEVHMLPGQALYEHNCMTCHGGDGTAGISGAANLRVSTLDSTALYNTIGQGRGNMPAFKHTLSAQDIALLVSYIHTLRK